MTGTDARTHAASECQRSFMSTSEFDMSIQASTTPMAVLRLPVGRGGGPEDNGGTSPQLLASQEEEFEFQLGRL